MSTQNRILVYVGLAFVICHLAQVVLPGVLPKSSNVTVPWLNAALGVLLILAGTCGIERLKGINLNLGKFGTFGFGMSRRVPTEAEQQMVVKSSMDYVAPELEKKMAVLESNADKRSDQKRSAADYLVLATRAWREGRPEDAIDFAYKGLSLNPDNKRLRATLLLRLASAYKGIDASKLRKKLFHQSLEVDPKFAWPHYNLGIFHQEAKRSAEAESAYREAIALEKNYAKARNNLGVLLKDTKRYADAEEEYRKVISIAPKYAKAHYNLGVLLQETGRESEAENKYREAISLDPENANAHSALGTVLHEQKNFDGAEKEYRKAITLDSANAKPHNNLGDLLRDTSRREEAEKEYREALSLDPNFSEARNSLNDLLQSSA